VAALRAHRKRFGALITRGRSLWMAASGIPVGCAQPFPCSAGSWGGLLRCAESHPDREGLHHIVNNIEWFLLGEYHGLLVDLKRFFEGDPSAGLSWAGFTGHDVQACRTRACDLYHAAGRKAGARWEGTSVDAGPRCSRGDRADRIHIHPFWAPALYAIPSVTEGIAFVHHGNDCRFGWDSGSGTPVSSEVTRSTR